MDAKDKFMTVEQYIATFPTDTQKILERVREAIKKAAPEAAEVISYGMPAFKLSGMLVYYAAYDKYIGFYPTPSGIKAFKEHLTSYKCSKGTVQFPLETPLPLELISKIVKFRVDENLEKAKLKKAK